MPADTTRSEVIERINRDLSRLDIGRAKPDLCPECSGKGVRAGHTSACSQCDGRGFVLWLACPNCGDITWDGLGNGQYACRIGCGFTWDESHPGWQIQRLPDAQG